MSIGNIILILCIGNICRSPAAEGFFADYFLKNNLPTVVSSAGIQAVVGSQASSHTRNIMLNEYGIDVGAHIAKQLNEDLVRNHDLILVMDEKQASILKQSYPFASGKVHRLGKWRDSDVKDPYRQSEAVFRSCLQLIHECTYDWIKKFWLR